MKTRSTKGLCKLNHLIEMKAFVYFTNSRRGKFLTCTFSEHKPRPMPADETYYSLALTIAIEFTNDSRHELVQ